VSVAVRDTNSDGHRDVIVANAGWNAVSVLQGLGGGTFLGPTTFGVGGQPLALRATLFPGDAKWDIVVLNQGPANVAVLLGTR
jgi:hypothetical protein